MSKRRKFNEFDLSETEEKGTGILIYEDKKYYFDIEDYDLISIFKSSMCSLVSSEACLHNLYLPTFISA